MQQRQLVARCTQYGACAAAEQPIKMQHTRIHPLQASVLRDARSALSLLFSFCQQGFSQLAASHNTCSVSRPVAIITAQQNSHVCIIHVHICICNIYGTQARGLSAHQECNSRILTIYTLTKFV